MSNCQATVAAAPKEVLLVVLAEPVDAGDVLAADDRLRRIRRVQIENRGRRGRIWLLGLCEGGLNVLVTRRAGEGTTTAATYQ